MSFSFDHLSKFWSLMLCFTFWVKYIDFPKTMFCPHVVIAHGPFQFYEFLNLSFRTIGNFHETAFLNWLHMWKFKPLRFFFFSNPWLAKFSNPQDVLIMLMIYRYITSPIASTKNKFENFIIENLWAHWCVHFQKRKHLSISHSSLDFLLKN